MNDLMDATVPILPPVTTIKGMAMENAIAVLQNDIRSIGELALERRASDQRALALQAAYTERRLVDITLAHELLRVQQTGLVSNAIYDRDRIAFDGQVRGLSKLVYVGIGVVMALQFVLALLPHIPTSALK